MSIATVRQPRIGEVAREQIRITGLLQRREMVLLTGLAVGSGILFGLFVLWDRSAAAWEIGAEARLEDLRISMLMMMGGWPLLLLAAIWPLSAWQKDPPSRRGYLWSAPVPRGPHILLRLVGSWVWLMAMTQVYMAIFALATLSRGAIDIGISELLGFAGRGLVGVTIVYLLASVLALRFEHPGRWLLGILFSFVAITIVSYAVGAEPVGNAVLNLFFHLQSAVNPLSPTEGLFATAIWLGIGLTGCLTAAFVHQEPGHP